MNLPTDESTSRLCLWMGEQIPCSEMLEKLKPFLWAIGIVGLILLIFYVICMWKVFVKAGKPGWAAIIPIYNMVFIINL